MSGHAERVKRLGKWAMIREFLAQGLLWLALRVGGDEFAFWLVYEMPNETTSASKETP